MPTGAQGKESEPSKPGVTLEPQSMANLEAASLWPDTRMPMGIEMHNTLWQKEHKACSLSPDICTLPPPVLKGSELQHLMESWLFNLELYLPRHIVPDKAQGRES